jgi:NADH:ubiquinone oxidoreductase subunit 4 (subunit M)
VHWNWAAWAATGVILSACYLLWSYQRVFFGEITVEKNRTLPDVSARERWILLTMAVITLWMGLGSVFITGRTAAGSQSVIEQMTRPPRAYDALAPAKGGPQVGGQPPSGSASVAQKPNSLERLGTR